MMKLPSKPMILTVLIGLLILNVSVPSATADQPLAEDQTQEICDSDETSHSRPTNLMSRHDRSAPVIGDLDSIINSMTDSARAIYRLVKVGDWASATEHLELIQSKAQRLQADPAIQHNELSQLNSLIMPLQNLIVAKQISAMDIANQFAMTISQLAIPSTTNIPTKVAMLDYYGHELELWSERANTAKLRTVADKMQQTWIDLRPEVQSHDVPQQVQKLDETLNALVQTATSPTQYQLLATPLLAEVHDLQRLFQLAA